MFSWRICRWYLEGRGWQSRKTSGELAGIGGFQAADLRQRIQCKSMRVWIVGMVFFHEFLEDGCQSVDMWHHKTPAADISQSAV